MSNLNVAILGAPEYGKELGKKGTVSDLTFYNLKKGENTVTLIEPSRYPERIAPLFYAISMSQKILLIVDQMDPAFGETVLMLDSVRSPLAIGTMVFGGACVLAFFVGDFPAAARCPGCGRRLKVRTHQDPHPHRRWRYLECPQCHQTIDLDS